AASNTVNGDPLLLERSDFEFGRSTETSSGRFEFASDSFPRNSVRVAGRRTVGSPSGPVPLFFGNLLGVNFFEPSTTATATYLERDIVLVVDRSGSMRGSKFNDLVDAINVFVQTLQETPSEEHVGLASYSQSATVDVNMTENLDRISSGVRSLNVGGLTSISRGMQSGQTIMNGSRNAEFVERTMIVMTDGRHNRGPEPRTTAQALAADGVKIHTITFGGNADLARMAEVAQIGGGQHFHADNGVELREIYREIALTLSTIITE
ncbi:MAG: VWA domain-containing protein, partial [Pirellulales bacterium]|nr:VWA domain-containing protein [Pirellulales bacterium]